MPAIKVADAYVPITGDNTPLRRTLTSTRGLLSGWVADIRQGIGQGIGQAIFNNIQRGIGFGLGLIRDSIRATSDLGETLSKTMTVFGASAKTIVDWSKTTSTSFGVSQRAALEATSSIGNMFLQMGEGSDEAAKLSIQMVQLAADLASFHNVAGGTESVLTDMQAAFRGEFDPIQKYIPLINAASVEQQALAESGKNAAKQLTALDKAVAVQTLIMQGAGVAAGDFARTINGIANQERILAARREDALANLGQAFSPIYLTILQGVNRLVDQISPYGENIIRMLATGMTRGVIYLLPALGFVRDVVTEWLRPGSPPKLLPDLVKWGQGAMEAYLGGWASADFGVLQNLGGTIESILRSFVTSGAIAENDIVSRVFGTRNAIARAISQWREAGQVTADSIQAIQDAAGPAGFALAGMVRAYFDVEGASRRAAAAQQELTDVTERYEQLLNPLRGQLDEINDKQQAIRDRQQISAFRRTTRDPGATANEKRLALLGIEEIKVRQQMDTVQEQRDLAVRAAEDKLKAARREEQTARAIYDAQQGLLDQQVKINSLIGEENTLRKQQEAEAERLYQAMQSYNLAIADTEGKLSLLRLELRRHKEGSVEYYNVLTQIAGLEEQLSNERASTESLVPPDSILPGVDDVGIPDWVKELQAELRRAFDEVFGSEPVVQAPVQRGENDNLNMEGLVTPDVGIKPEVSQQVKEFVAALKELAVALTDITPPLEALGRVFGVVEEESGDSAAGVRENTTGVLEGITKEIILWSLIFNGEWAKAWRIWKEEQDAKADAAKEDWKSFLVAQTESDNAYFRTTATILLAVSNARDAALTALNTWRVNYFNAVVTWKNEITSEWGAAFTSWSTALGTWLTETAAGLTTFLTDVQTAIADWDLAEAGRAWIKSLYDGAKAYWEETVVPWWQNTALGKIADMLPGSEPKDPSSPLAGLKDRGRAIVSQLQLGIDEVGLQMPNVNQAQLAAGATTNSSRSVVIEEGAFVFNGVAGAAEAESSLVDAVKKLFGGL